MKNIMHGNISITIVNRVLKKALRLKANTAITENPNPCWGALNSL